jgi:hypothetical protein
MTRAIHIFLDALTLSTFFGASFLLVFLLMGAI